MKTAVWAIASVLTLSSCGPSIYANYDYSKEYDPRKHEYVIGVADVVTISVYRNADLSGAGIVRPDGVVTMPLIGDILVAGKTPTRIREDMKRMLAQYMKEEPVVTITVTGFNSYRFSVAGNVTRSGSFSQHYYVTISEAVAIAGGPNKFAADQIIVLRPDKSGKMREIPVSYKAILSGKHPEQDLAIVAGDTIVVQ